jgi:hypothetical protein
MGYKATTIKVLKDQAQTVEITLLPATADLQEVVVRYTENIRPLPSFAK